MSKTDKLLAPRDAATDDDDSNEGSQAASDYDSEGSLDDNPETTSVVQKPVVTNAAEEVVAAEAPAGVAAEDVNDAEDDDDEEDEDDDDEENEGKEGGRGQEVGEVKEEEDSERNIRGRGRQKVSREPYEVPTSGAFYMHDDRFAAEGPASNTRGMDRRKKNGIDDKKWKHDKFEELERDYELGKPFVPRGRRGRAGRGGGRGRSDGRPRERGGYERGGYDKAYRDQEPVYAENQPNMDPGRRQDFDDGDRWKKNSDYHHSGGVYPMNGNGMTAQRGRSGRSAGGGGGGGGRGYSSRGR
ncbi:hypothetical protein BSKO_01858 [Bryopsis sp. KO-2023]|nr:hypothetical protein BSKO_01858 [Bryopsis sp. KO-2023]